MHPARLRIDQSCRILASAAIQSGNGVTPFPVGKSVTAKCPVDHWKGEGPMIVVAHYRLARA